MANLALPAAVLLLNLAFFFPANSQVNPDFWRCSGPTNYTADSPFKSNLDLLLAELTLVSPNATEPVYKTSSVEGSDDVYGLSQCRPDVLGRDCAACLNRSAVAASLLCPLRRRAAILFEDCFLRFSDSRFFGALDVEGSKKYFNPNLSSDPASFDRTLTELLSDVTSRAAAGSFRFAAGKRNISDFVAVYGIAQCTRDISAADCSECGNYLLGRMERSGSIGGEAYVSSCSIFYKIRPFFSLYLLPPPSNGTSFGEGKREGKRLLFILVVALGIIVFILLAFSGYLLGRKTRRSRNDNAEACIRFTFGSLKSATRNFCERNKLGQGGFGPVYLGVLPDGRQIAVKRLSKTSTQGVAEMTNEVVLISKLHHKNLVRLLGFCLEDKEKLIVYEYLPNQSLDKFLFDPERNIILTWETRLKVIEGICRGLTYLHEASMTPIIHRDLKSSNILLDGDMNPKISDFGLAKLFPMNETHCSTSHVAGTRGYMAPEYIFNGHFSPKSDVFSFGVIILELVTGQRIGDFSISENSENLLSFVWSHWVQGTEAQVVEQSVGAQCQREEVIRCIHIGLLCVQEKPSQRPSMQEVALMLYSSSLSLPAPSKPGFHTGESNSRLFSKEDGCEIFGNVEVENGRAAHEITKKEVVAR